MLPLPAKASLPAFFGLAAVGLVIERVCARSSRTASCAIPPRVREGGGKAVLFFTPASRLPEGCAGVPIFSAAHLRWLFPVLALCAVVTALFSRAKPPARRRVLHGMAAALPALLFGRIALLLLTGGLLRRSGICRCICAT